MASAKQVWKFELSLAGSRIEMPVGARVLTVQTQLGRPCLWALVDPERAKEERLFVVYGTGHPIAAPDTLAYVGTFQDLGGRLIWHVFEQF